LVALFKRACGGSLTVLSKLPKHLVPFAFSQIPIEANRIEPLLVVRPDFPASAFAPLIDYPSS